MSRRRSDNEFLDCLEDVFLKRGIRGVTISDIASELRCSRRRLYEHADGKEALFLKVIERFFSAIRAEGHKAAEAANGLDGKIRAYLEPGVQGAMRLSDAFQEDIADFAPGKAIYDRHQKLRIEGLQQIIEDGMGTGEVRQINARMAAEMMLLIVKRIRQPDFQREAGISFAQGLAQASEILRRGVLTPGISEKSHPDSLTNSG